jgi:uncharacterized membrane protein YeaQ/YmgE (transglycosylase-associated protein family)
MEPLAWIVVGLIAGFLAAQVVPSGFGLLVETVIGMVGAILGGWLFQQFGEAGTNGLTVWSVLVAFVGAGRIIA